MLSSGASVRTLVGICAYNEENNIGRLLKNLLTEPNLPDDCRILALCSGCTDRTPQIIREWCKRYTTIELVVEESRRGKANALNKIFKKAKESADVLLLVNADALPEHGSIKKLVSRFTNEKTGAVFARPVPLNRMRGVSNRIVHIVWNLHHRISCYKAPKFSAELCAIRTSCLEEIPEDVATDEPYIELSIRKQGYGISYAPDAIVFIRGPTNLIDLFKQRRRIWIGHLQIQKMAGFIVPTSNLRNTLWTVSTLKLAEFPYALLGGILECLAYLIARLNFSRGKIPYAWEAIKSTKTSI